MKNKISILGIVIVLILIASIYINNSSASNAGGQRIELSTNYFDLGDINPDKGIRTEIFSVKNTGTDPLNIIYVSTSCGCTKAEVESDVILPGGETKLTVSYDPSIHPGLVGKIQRVVYVKSDDPTNEEVELVLVGNSLPSASASTTNDTQIGSDDMKDFEISPLETYSKIKDNEPVKLLDVREENEFEAGYIDGALLLSVDRINQDELDRLGLKKDDAIVVYCRSGKRSARAYEMLTELGYTNVKSMAGGINHWVEDGLPTEKKGMDDMASPGGSSANQLEGIERDAGIFKENYFGIDDKGVCEL